MRAEIAYIFYICQFIGAGPFQVWRGRIKFEWASRQVLFFAAVFVYCLISLTFVSRATIKTLLDGDTVAGFGYMAWTAAYLATTLVQMVMLWKRNEICGLIDNCATLWETNKTDQRYHIKKIIWPLHLLWFAQSFLFPAVTIALLNIRHPATTAVLWSSCFCERDDDCPSHVVAASIALQTVTLLYGYAAILIMDVLPMAVAIHSTRALKLTAAHLEDHIDGCCTFKCHKKKEINKVGPQVVMPVSTPEEKNYAMSEAIRTVMANNLTIQRQLKKGVPAFGPLIILCLAQVFAMCIVLFFSIFKQGLSDPLQTAVYMGNGFQYLIRGTIVFSALGNVREEAQRMRGLLLLRSDLLEGVGRSDPALLGEVALFVSTLDDVAFTAGPYFTCTHSFVFTFYGILATYLAILVQSL